MPTSKTAHSPIIILGIDPGFADTGYGIIKKGTSYHYIICDNITTPARTKLGSRLKKIDNELKKIISKYQPDLIAIEQIFFSKNVKTAIDVAHARGAILLRAELEKIPVTEFTPSQVKLALTSYGHATKKQVEQMVKTLLRTSKLPKKDDAIDALAIALCAAFENKHFI